MSKIKSRKSPGSLYRRYCSFVEGTEWEIYRRDDQSFVEKLATGDSKESLRYELAYLSPGVYLFSIPFDKCSSFEILEMNHAVRRVIQDGMKSELLVLDLVKLYLEGPEIRRTEMQGLFEEISNCAIEEMSNYGIIINDEEELS